MTARKRKAADMAGAVGLDSASVTVGGVEISSIVTGANVREDFGSEAMASLVASIKAHGIIEPLIVCESSEKDRYTLIAGERRLRAAEECGYSQVPCVIYPRLDERQVSALMLAENLVRSDLTPIERAQGFACLVSFGLKQSEIADMFGITQGYVSQTIRLLDIPEVLRPKIIAGVISQNVAQTLLRFKDASWFDDFCSWLADRDFDSITSKQLIEDYGHGLYGFVSIGPCKDSFISCTRYGCPSVCKECQRPCRIQIFPGTAFCTDRECFDSNLKAEAEAKAVSDVDGSAEAEYSDDDIDEIRRASEEDDFQDFAVDFISKRLFSRAYFAASSCPDSFVKFVSFGPRFAKARSVLFGSGDPFELSVEQAAAVVFADCLSSYVWSEEDYSENVSSFSSFGLPVLTIPSYDAAMDEAKSAWLAEHPESRLGEDDIINDCHDGETSPSVCNPDEEVSSS